MIDQVLGTVTAAAIRDPHQGVAVGQPDVLALDPGGVAAVRGPDLEPALAAHLGREV